MPFARFASVATRRFVSTDADHHVRLRQHLDDLQVLTGWPNAFDEALSITHQLADEQRARLRRDRLPVQAARPARVVSLVHHRAARGKAVG